MNEESAYVVLDLLKGVTIAGSGVRLRTKEHYYKDIITGFPYEFTNPIAGKTGTTQNHTRWMVYGSSSKFSNRRMDRR